MNFIRLKTGLVPEIIQTRLLYNPDIIEFHLEEVDLHHIDKIIHWIRKVKEKGTRVYLHHPTNYQGQRLDIISSDNKIREYFDWSCEILASICKQEDVLCVVHAHYTSSESSNFQDRKIRTMVRNRIEKILNISDSCFLWEDTTEGIFSQQNPFLFSEIIKPLQLRLTLDVSHSFIALKGDNTQLKRVLDQLSSYIDYYHLVDSSGEFHDSLPLGMGKIEWKMVKPFVQNKDFIFEIDLSSSNHYDCTPMIESAKFFSQVGSSI